MPQLRNDPVTREWVIITQERSQRPGEVRATNPAPAESLERSPDCPFCPGNESQTPPEVLAFRGPGGVRDGAGWTVRVVPNKYPALGVEGDLSRRGQGMYDCMNGIGAHEVVVETPVHNQSLATLTTEQCADVLWACHERMVDLSGDRRFKYILFFRNEGRSAGASLDHPHSQIIALPMVPSNIMGELEGMAQYAEYRDRCPYCDMVRQEADTGERVVFETDHHLVFEPYASKFPFETWVLPREHQPSFTDLAYEDMRNVATALQEAIRRLDGCLGRPAYNLAMHTLPMNTSRPEDFHWHIQISPRFTITAGFELGTGVYINATSPEDAARLLRDAAEPAKTEAEPAKTEEKGKRKK